MSLKLNTKYVENFINADELDGIKAQVELAASVLHEGSGLGNDFLGWLDLPENYDKEE
ncbi:MAG TPA: glucose-6-phosphate isomerase, partial [Ruminococcus sp.]|nr:glucose-6-phosphate isomerase [Ruminococcus sp.]